MKIKNIITTLGNSEKLILDKLYIETKVILQKKEGSVKKSVMG